MCILKVEGAKCNMGYSLRWRNVISSYNFYMMFVGGSSDGLVVMIPSVVLDVGGLRVEHPPLP